MKGEEGLPGSGAGLGRGVGSMGNRGGQRSSQGTVAGRGGVALQAAGSSLDAEAAGGGRPRGSVQGKEGL